MHLQKIRAKASLVFFEDAFVAHLSLGRLFLLQSLMFIVKKFVSLKHDVLLVGCSKMIAEDGVGC